MSTTGYDGNILCLLQNNLDASLNNSKSFDQDIQSQKMRLLYKFAGELKQVLKLLRPIVMISEVVKIIMRGFYLCEAKYFGLWVVRHYHSRCNCFYSIRIRIIVTRELDMNEFCEFQVILVYSTAGLLNFFDSFSL